MIGDEEQWRAPQYVPAAPGWFVVSGSFGKVFPVLAWAWPVPPAGSGGVLVSQFGFPELIEIATAREHTLWHAKYEPELPDGWELQPGSHVPAWEDS